MQIFGRLRSSATNISETDKDIQNRIFIPSTAIPPALGKTTFFKGESKIALKCSVLDEGSLQPKGVAS